MAVDWIGNKPGTFVNESTNVPLDADNMNAITRTLDEIAEGGEGSGLDADLFQGKELNDLAKVFDEDLSIYVSFDKESYGVGSYEKNNFLNNNVQDLVLIGSEAIATTSGVCGRSALFNGNSYFQGIYENSGPISISFWYKGTTTALEKIVSAYRISSDYRISIGVNLGKLVFSWKNTSNANEEIISASSINDGNFHHICCVHSGTSAFLYIDGELESQLAQTLATSTVNTLRVGASIGEVPTIMNGQIDELKIYKRALSSFEAHGLFFNPSSNKEYNTDITNNPHTLVERDENGSIKSTSTFIENIELKRKVDNVDSTITIGSTKEEVELNVNTNATINDSSIVTTGSNVTLPTAGTLTTNDGVETLTNKTLTLPKINSEVETSVTSEDLNSLNGVTGNVQDQLNGTAPIDSPNFTGIPTAPDLAINQNDEQIANAKSVMAQINNNINHLNALKNWDETYPYSLNEIVFYEGVIYKSLSDLNSGNQPDLTVGTSWENVLEIESHGDSHAGDGSDPIPVATQSVDGLMSSEDKTTLDGLAGGELNTILTLEASSLGLTYDNTDLYSHQKFSKSLSREIGELITLQHRKEPITWAEAKSTANPSYPEYFPAIPRYDGNHDITSAQAPLLVSDFITRSITSGTTTIFSGVLTSGVIALNATVDNDHLCIALVEAALVLRWHDSGQDADYATLGGLYSGTGQYCVCINNVNYGITNVDAVARTITIDSPPADGAVDFTVPQYGVPGSNTSIRLRQLSGFVPVACGDYDGDILEGLVKMDRLQFHFHNRNASGTNEQVMTPGGSYQFSLIVAAGGTPGWKGKTAGMVTDDVHGTPRGGKTTDPRGFGVAIYTWARTLLAKDWA